MLVLSRKAGQSLFVGDEIEIKVTEISGDRVRIGIEAPKHLRIMRQELRQTEQANREAAGALPSAAWMEELSILVPQGAPQQKNEP